MLFHVVDTQPVICEFVSTIFDVLGHETRTFHSHEEYLAYLECDEYQRPAAIFADISMPVASGYAMLRKVQSIYPGQTFVVISGMPNIETECRYGNCLILKKPFGISQLEGVVAEITRKKAA